jgi:hypothetical protein
MAISFEITVSANVSVIHNDLRLFQINFIQAVATVARIKTDTVYILHIYELPGAEEVNLKRQATKADSVHITTLTRLSMQPALLQASETGQGGILLLLVGVQVSVPTQDFNN